MKNVTKEDWDVLDLTDAESKVLWALIEGGRQSVSATARRARVPRTTADAALERLHERKVARPIGGGGKGKKRLWRAVKPEKIKEELKEAAEPFTEREKTQQKQETPQQSDILNSIGADELGIYAFHGKQQIQAAYERMLDLSKTERVYCIQGNRSAEAALERTDRQYLFDFHQNSKQSGVHIEGINGESVLNLFKRVSVQALISHKERFMVMSVLPDKYLDFNADIVVLRETTLFIDIINETVIVINNPTIADVFRHLVALLQETGRRVDLNEYIRSLIAEKRDTQ